MLTPDQERFMNLGGAIIVIVLLAPVSYTHLRAHETDS